VSHLNKTETTESILEEDIFIATGTLGSATQAALAAAKKWLEEYHAVKINTTQRPRIVCAYFGLAA